MKKRIRDGSIIALRMKCAVQESHRYAGAVVLVDRQEHVVIRSAAVVSHNPAVCELDVHDAWDAVERAIYRYKLQPGADFVATKDLLLRMHHDEPELVQARDGDAVAGVFRTMVAGVLGIEDVAQGGIRCSGCASVLRSDIPGDDTPDAVRMRGFARTIEHIHEGAFFIRVRPVLDDRRGVPPHRLRPRCMVECEIIDKREVVRYIIGLLYGTGKSVIQGRVIESEAKPNGYTQITIAITPVIFSRLVLHTSQRVRTA